MCLDREGQREKMFSHRIAHGKWEVRELGVAYNEVGDSVPQIVPNC